MAKGKNTQSLSFRLRKVFFILYSIIFSFSPAAYFVLFLKFLQILCYPIDLLLHFIENKKLPGADQKSVEKLPLIFVVGIQRTGSTFISQVLSKTFPFFPLGNFATLFPRSKYFIHKWMKRYYTPDPHKRNRNFYGISKGMYTIGDSYEIWDKWFGKNHYNIPGEISGKKKKQLQSYFYYLTKAYDKPIITKNNRNSLLLPLFHEMFPNAVFIVTHRDPASVILSTLKANEDFFGNEKYMWGLRPSPDFNPEEYDDIIQAACVQYTELDKLLKKQIAELPSDCVMNINYKEFCENPKKHQERIAEFIKPRLNINSEDIKYIHQPFQRSKRLKNSSKYNRIKVELDKLKDK